MRLFFAIELPDAVCGALAGLMQGLRREWGGTGWPGVSWVREPNLHVTVKFLGEVPDADVPSLVEVMKQVPTTGPLRLRVGAAELLPPRGPVRVIAAGLAGDLPRLTQLHGAVEDACHAAGFPREGRAYRPHVTLARARKPLPGTARAKLIELLSAGPPGPEVDVTQLTLMQSKLQSGGSEYTPVAHFPLGDPGQEATGAAG